MTTRARFWKRCEIEKTCRNKPAYLIDIHWKYWPKERKLACSDCKSALDEAMFTKPTVVLDLMEIATVNR